MSTAATHAHNGNSLFNLNGACIGTMRLKAGNSILSEAISSAVNKMVVAYSAEIHCPTIEQITNLTNIKRWDKQ